MSNTTTKLRDGTDEAMHRVGEWVMTPAVADRLGLTGRMRRTSFFSLLAGAAVGVAAGMMIQRRRDEAQEMAHEAEHQREARNASIPPLGRGQIDLTAAPENAPAGART